MNMNGAPTLPRTLTAKPFFSYCHVISFEETNVVGNVYFVRHVAWQGRCREMFLRLHAPEILKEISRDLRLVTLRASCDYYHELYALDEIIIQMSLAHLRQHRIGLDFNIIIQREDDAICAARGFQEIGCLRATENGLVPIRPPKPLADALKPYAPLVVGSDVPSPGLV